MIDTQICRGTGRDVLEKIDTALAHKITLPFTTSVTSDDIISDPNNLLNNIRISNANKLIIGQLNINSLRNKFDALKTIISGKIDILVITESKLDESFPTNQFLIYGFSLPFRRYRDLNGGGVIIFVREDISCRELKLHNTPDNFEGIVLEVNLRKVKRLLFGGYNPQSGHTKLSIKT